MVSCKITSRVGVLDAVDAASFFPFLPLGAGSVCETWQLTTVVNSSRRSGSPLKLVLAVVNPSYSLPYVDRPRAQQEQIAGDLMGSGGWVRRPYGMWEA